MIVSPRTTEYAPAVVAPLPIAIAPAADDVAAFPRAVAPAAVAFVVVPTAIALAAEPVALEPRATAAAAEATEVVPTASAFVAVEWLPLPMADAPAWFATGLPGPIACEPCPETVPPKLMFNEPIATAPLLLPILIESAAEPAA